MLKIRTKEIFPEWNITYDLKNNNEFMLPRERAINYGLETITYRGRHLWLSFPQYEGILNLLLKSRKQLRIGMAVNAPADYVETLYHSLDFCNTKLTRNLHNKARI